LVELLVDKTSGGGGLSGEVFSCGTSGPDPSLPSPFSNDGGKRGEPAALEGPDISLVMNRCGEGVRGAIPLQIWLLGEGEDSASRRIATRKALAAERLSCNNGVSPTHQTK